MSTIEIRHSEPKDAEALQAIHGQSSTYTGTLQLPFPSLAMWKDRLENKPEHFYSLVAEIEGRVVGHIGLHVCALPRRRHAAEVGMVVDEEFRRHGIGSRLLSEVIRLAEGWLGLHRLELEVFSDNAAARALYEKHGFVSEGVAKDYAFRDGAYADVVRMARLRARSPL